MRASFLLNVLIFSLFFPACCPRDNQRAWAENAVGRAGHQLRATAVRFESDTASPRSFRAGTYRMAPLRDWTCGFYPGSLWQMYELTNDPFFLEKAKIYTAKLDGIQFFTHTHDLGFMVFTSFGNQYRNLKDPHTAAIIMTAADNLMARYHPRIGLIRSWDFGKWNFPVIIDNMMNLEMLFWASRYSDDPTYRNAAIRHADLTALHHFRHDYSAYHVVSYNDDGSVAFKGTHQGYGDQTAWARGEAWALYGYTMCYRYTQKERYLQQAERIAAFVMNHPATPKDLIPYWDYDDPRIPDAPRDASAAAIYASALLELSAYAGGENAKRYFDYAERILRSLSSNAYLASEGANGGFILQHSVGNLPNNSEIDVPLNYADYYFLEGLKRYLAMITPGPAGPNGTTVF